jgi:hypothetical protein
MNWDYGALQQCWEHSPERISRRAYGFAAQFSIAQRRER